MLMHWSSLGIGLYCVLTSISGSLHATPYHNMCISIFQQITKMYDMLNKNSQGLLKRALPSKVESKLIVRAVDQGFYTILENLRLIG